MAYLARSLVGFHPDSTEDASQLKGVEIGDKVVCFPLGSMDDKARGIAQNRLYWKWLTAMSLTRVEQHRGHTKEDWHKRMKKDFLVRIFERDDQGYAETIATLRELYKHDKKMANDLYDGIVRLTSTTQASVKQFSEYLTCIDRYCADEGIRLPADPGLEEMAIIK